MSETISPLALGQLSIVVRDMRKSLAFYRLLGLSMTVREVARKLRVSTALGDQVRSAAPPSKADVLQAIADTLSGRRSTRLSFGAAVLETVPVTGAPLDSAPASRALRSGRAG
jgi:hypothetical protein